MTLIGKLMDDSFEEFVKLTDTELTDLIELRTILKNYKALGVK